MIHPATNVFHECHCAALARFHTFVGLRAKDQRDARFHLDRANAFIACISLPPDQMRMVLNLAAKFPAFGALLVRLTSPAGLHRQSP
jgi:hypothetical protein